MPTVRYLVTDLDRFVAFYRRLGFTIPGGRLRHPRPHGNPVELLDPI